MNESRDLRSHDAWARLRFSIIGHLMAAPPADGELHAELVRLAARKWHHPITGEPKGFGFSTIERWYYDARNDKDDPVKALRRRIRSDAGLFPAMGAKLCDAVRALYQDHKSWSIRLHHDNLAVLAEENRELGKVPSYSTVGRWMRSQGLLRQPRKRRRLTAGEERAEARHELRETRSYEVEYVNGLWHLDFHEGSRPVILRSGLWHEAQMLAVLDDCSRLCCHGQWYLDETVETLVHGYCQSVQKRGLPRSVMSDNGSAMRAAEFKKGLDVLSILHEETLPYSPEQNGKQEVFWASVEGRLIPMLEGEKELTLELLNQATQAWIEHDYNHKLHSEIGTTPIRRFLDHKNVSRESPSSEALRSAFRVELKRKQRMSDGTISLCGQRFEIPSRYRTLKDVHVRYASWDLGFVHLVDARTSDAVCRIYPLDKAKNAEGIRKAKEPIGGVADVGNEPTPPSGIAPLLRKMMADYSATGLPPAYLPKHDLERSEQTGQSADAEEAKP